MRLEALFRPKSIAVIGASEKPTIGRRLIASLDRFGFAGPVFPVNPGYATVLGRTCYTNLGELPEAPDIAAFCVGHERVLKPLAAAAERGVKGAVIYDGGFAERGNGGRRRQSQIAGICRDYGIALCGPNCMGVLNPHHHSSTYLQELRDPAGLAGNVGIVSQSGAFCVSLLNDVRRFGFSHVVSSGNEAVLAAADYLEYLADDPHTKVIGGFIETVRDPDRFVAALDRAAAQRKPVVVLKVGGAERTRHAITTHTGGVAGDPGFVSELLRAHQAIEVADLVEFTEVIAAAQSMKPPAGRRIGVVTSSGGLAELILDIAASADLQLPPLSAAAMAEVGHRIGFVSGDGNPLDAWGNGTFLANLPHAFGVFDASPDHDIVVFCRDNCDGQPFEAPDVGWTYLELFERAAANSSKPHYLLHTRPGVMNREQVARLRDAGIAVVGGIREGLGAIDRLARNSISEGV
ncbi:MAG: CoA-binding protein [Alphaproteobacteria bacterium]|nr:CoA-binding protein [Alphaproteobacteria bacterium]